MFAHNQETHRRPHKCLDGPSTPDKCSGNEHLLDGSFPSHNQIKYDDQSGQLRNYHLQTFERPWDLRHALPAGVSLKPVARSTRSLGHNEARKSAKLDIHQANKLLSLFQKANSYFPFVVIPKNATIKTLSIEYPFPALAILTISSTTDFVLHRLLNERFRHILSAKVIVQREKSLDYLQGLLIYPA
jgi:hypothetical protein